MGAAGEAFDTPLDVAAAGRVAPGFCVTMSCSPVLSPRLSSGSSGIKVRLCGGYPAFTAHAQM